MTSAETIELYKKYVIANYTKTPIVFVRGEGSWLWDAEGKRYLDLFPGWGVNGIGHCHPRVVAALREQAGKLMHVANNYYMEPQARLAQLIAERSFGGRTFFCNSGAEANEGAMKLARLATSPERHQFITFLDSFHGRTMAAISATGQPKYHRGFEPIMPGFKYAPFNDLEAVEELVDEQTCAIMVEPIQGEGGVNVARPEFLRGLRAICDHSDMRLIFDEVQTGCGRTGKWFGYQQFGVTPDIMTLAKAIAGGPALGAVVATPEVADKLVPGTHASTFGGNPLACAAGVATFETIEAEGLLENATRMGVYAMDRLVALREKFDFIREVRGKGMMIGVELDRPGKGIVERCLKMGVLINCTHDVVLRLLPSMAVTQDQLDEGIDAIAKAMAGEDVS